MFVCGAGRYQFATAIALSIPVFVVVTKTDTCTQAQLTRTLTQITHALKGSAKTAGEPHVDLIRAPCVLYGLNI